MEIIINVTKKKNVFVATAYYPDGNEIGHIVAFSAKLAKSILKRNLGLTEVDRYKKVKKAVSKASHKNSSCSFMSGLINKTASTDWRKTK